MVQQEVAGERQPGHDIAVVSPLVTMSLADCSVSGAAHPRSAAYVARALGQTGINLIGRVMGLMLAATAAQFVLDGVREAFPRLFG